LLSFTVSALLLGLTACSDKAADTGAEPSTSETDDTSATGDTTVGDTDPPTETGPGGADSTDSGPDTAPPTETGEPSPGIDPYAAVFLWEALTFDDAVPMGFEPSEIPAGEQAEPGAVTLTEVGFTAGLTGAVAGGNSHGVGVGFFDYDGDGWADILVGNGVNGSGSPSYNSSLWRNNRDGTFSDVSLMSGLGAILHGFDVYSVTASDYDADGDLDVYITAHPHDFLLQNDGDGTFTDATAAAGAGGPESEPASNGSSKIAAWGDYDGDGLIDVVVASSQFLDAEAHGYLLRNLGDGTFADATADAKLQVAVYGNPCAVLWTDYDNDGDQDLWIWNDRGGPDENRAILRNDDGRFEDVTVDVGADNAMNNPMAIDAADVNRDGWLDYYIGNIGNAALLHAQGDGTFVEWGVAAGVTGEYTWGLGFEDLDRDGWWDIFVAQEDERPYLTFTNLRGETPLFTEQSWPHPEVVDSDAHNVAVAFADYDHDGDVDIVTAGTGGVRVNLFRNDTDPGTTRWLHVEVPSSPERGERGGVSGRVVVKTGDVVRYRDLQAGSSRASMNEMSVRFGLGQYTGAEWVAVLWPDGRISAVTGVEGNQKIQMP